MQTCYNVFCLNWQETDQQGAKAWEGAHPEDFARVFEEFFEGVWWDMVQEKIGKTFTVGGIIFYSDSTNILSHMSAYPIYSKYIKCCQMV